MGYKYVIVTKCNFVAFCKGERYEAINSFLGDVSNMERERV